VSVPLLLASASPRRREMLERIGLAIEVHPADVDETPQAGEAPEAYVARIARAKAMVIARSGSAGPRSNAQRCGELIARSGASDHWVLAADTTVTLEGAILGKADSPEEATKMLRWLSGRAHQVLTAFVLVGEREGKTCVREGLVSTEVVMVDVDAATLADYVASGEWRGKAGAYAIQGIGAALVSEVRGSVTNVAGLPLAEVVAALREVGAPLPRFTAGTPA
jgi:septum formation protein